MPSENLIKVTFKKNSNSQIINKTLEVLPMVFMIFISYKIFRMVKTLSEKGSGGLMGMFKQNHKQF